MSDVQVSKNETDRQYEARIDGALAGTAHYEVRGETIVFDHTVTGPEFGGKGVASALARRSLEDAREQGLTVIPSCSFYAGYIDKHPEYADLLR